MIGIVASFPHGANVRNFFLTDTYETIAAADATVVALTTMAPDAAFVKEWESERVTFAPLCPYTPSKAEAAFDHFCRLLFLPGSDYLTYLYEPALKRRPWIKLPFLPFWVTGLWKAGWFVRSLRKLRVLFFYDDRYERLLKDARPDLVVATRLFDTDEWRLVEAARRLGIPTAGIIASWDNLNSYAYLPAAPDTTIVWNEVMKAEAVEKHGADPERIVISGPPQFDVYFRPDLQGAPEEYRGKFGIGEGEKLVTFATADILTDQPAMAELIYETTVKGRPGRRFLVRVHPQEAPEPYAALKEKYPDIILDIPGAKQQGVADRIFTKNDLYDLARLMRFSDVVINVCSTIALDGSAADTPTICYRSLTVYGDKARVKRIIEAHDRTHFKPLVDIDGLWIADDEEALAAMVDAALADPVAGKAEREAAAALMIPRRDGTMARRLGDALLSLAK
jgi:hypothetical protein